MFFTAPSVLKKIKLSICLIALSSFGCNYEKPNERAGQLESDSATEIHHATLQMDNDLARSCDLLFDVQHITPEPNIVFSPTTLGVHIHRPPKLAISITSTTDAPFSDDAVTIEGDVEGITLEKAICYDRLGNVLPGESVVWR